MRADLPNLVILINVGKLVNELRSGLFPTGIVFDDQSGGIYDIMWEKVS